MVIGVRVIEGLTFFIVAHGGSGSRSLAVNDDGKQTCGNGSDDDDDDDDATLQPFVSVSVVVSHDNNSDDEGGVFVGVVEVSTKSWPFAFSEQTCSDDNDADGTDDDDEEQRH